MLVTLTGLSVVIVFVCRVDDDSGRRFMPVASHSFDHNRIRGAVFSFGSSSTLHAGSNKICSKKNFFSSVERRSYTFSPKLSCWWIKKGMSHICQSRFKFTPRVHCELRTQQQQCLCLFVHFQFFVSLVRFLTTTWRPNVLTDNPISLKLTQKEKANSDW